MGFWSDYKKKKEKERRKKEYRKQYAEYFEVEDDIKSRMRQIPPDYEGVANILKDIKELPYDAEIILALCYSRNSPSKALDIVKPRYEYAKEQGEKDLYSVEIAIYEYAMGHFLTGKDSRSHFYSGTKIDIPKYKPAYFCVIPALCRAEEAWKWYSEASTKGDVEYAIRLCRSILDDGLIPEGYYEYSLVKMMLEGKAQDGIAKKNEEKKRLEEEQERKLAQITEQYNETLHEKVEKLLQEDPPKYSEVKDLFYEYKQSIPDEGKLYLAISTWNDMQLKKDLTEDQKRVEKVVFEALIDSINTNSAALWYYRSLNKTGKEAAECLRRGAWCSKETNIFDKELRIKCLKKYGEFLFNEAISSGTNLIDIETGEGKTVYNEMKQIACALVGDSYADEFELWNRIEKEQEGAICSYVRYVIAALIKQIEKNDRAYARRKVLLNKFTLEEISDYGNYYFDGAGNDKYIGYLFYDAILSEKGNASLKIGIDSYCEILNSILPYCLNNGYMMDGYSYGDYILKYRRSKSLDEIHMPVHAWIMQGNNGYFLIDDRPDENGKYSDGGRVRADAFRASVVYDGALV